jgi:hypothetical protein
MKLFVIASLVVLLSACAGPARTSAPEAAPAQTQESIANETAIAELRSNDPEYWDEIICRREPVTGTRLTRGRCHSRYDWARMQGAATEFMRELENRPIPVNEGN